MTIEELFSIPEGNSEFLRGEKCVYLHLKDLYTDGTLKSWEWSVIENMTRGFLNDIIIKNQGKKLKKLYCAKNVVCNWAGGGNHCDGPNGIGVEESCIGCNAYQDEDELIYAIGEYVTRKMGVV